MKSAIAPTKEKESLFIVIEGLDGSGKTTAGRRLVEILDRENPGKIKFTYEPHDPSAAGLYIRQVLMKKIRDFTPRVLALAFATNRLDHCDREINPWFAGEKGRLVISDRYYLSSLVYQSAEDFPFERVMELNELARKPDLIFFLNVSNEVCLQRMQKRNAPEELFESNLSQTRQKFLNAIEFLRSRGHDNIHEIDANGTLEEVVGQLLQGIGEYAPEWIPADIYLPEEKSSSSSRLMGEGQLSFESFMALVEAEEVDEDNEDGISEVVEKLLDKCSREELKELFLEFLEQHGLEVLGNLDRENVDAVELEYSLPLGVNSRGIALFLSEGQKYDEILKTAPQLAQMSDFIYVISPGPAEPEIEYYERDRVEFATQPPASGLFPAIKVITREDLSILVQGYVVSDEEDW
ncbi:MAG: dTMP kinase [Bacteroidia bacterium]|nr:dTMP kinase [Bacteroidia bacterium]